MKKLLLFLFTFGLLISTSVTAEIVLYCNGEMATGFIKKNGVWRTTNFELKRYTIKFSDDYSEVKGLLKGIAFQCKNAYKSEASNTVLCRNNILGNGDSFTYNINTKRFIYFEDAVSGFINNRIGDNVDERRNLSKVLI